MAGLFGSGLGLGFNQGLGQSVGKSVGEGGLDEGTATSLALLNAMRQQQEAGLQRTATPIGSIAQNLIPLFGALIMGKAMSQQAAANQDAAELDNTLKASQIAKNLQPQQSNIQQELVNAIRAGDRSKIQQLIDTQKAIQRPPADTDYSLLRQANPNASPQELLDLQQKRKEAESASGTTATTTAGIQAKRALKEDLKPSDIDDYVKMTTGINSMGKMMDTLETPGGAPSQRSGAIAKLSGGMLSNEFWRKYAAFRNDVINKRFKSRFTGPEGEALAQELPDPMAYAADPKGFLKSIRVAFDHAQDILKTTYDYDSDVFNMGPRLTLGVVGATQPRGGQKKGQPAPGGEKTQAPANTVDSLINEVYGQ